MTDHTMIIFLITYPLPAFTYAQATGDGRRLAARVSR